MVGCGPSAPPDPPTEPFLQLDVTSEDDVEATVETTDPDVVFHLAGIMQGSPDQIEAVIGGGVVNLVAACRSHDAGLLVVGSAAEYGSPVHPELPISEAADCNPTTPYGRAKLHATETALAFGREGGRAIVVRPFNLLGPGVPDTTVVGRFLELARPVVARGGGTVTMGPLDARRDFLAVQDAVAAYEALVAAGAWGRVVNVCSGVPTRTRSLIDRLRSLSPVPLAVIEDAGRHPAGVDTAFGDPSLLKTLVDFSPSVTLEASLQETWEAAMELGVNGSSRS